MTTITIKIDQRKKEAKALLEYLKNLPFVEVETDKPSKEEDCYDPEFVKMVLNSAKNEKGTVINPDDVWGSLGLK